MAIGTAVNTDTTISIQRQIYFKHLICLYNDATHLLLTFQRLFSAFFVVGLLRYGMAAIAVMVE